MSDIFLIRFFSALSVISTLAFFLSRAIMVANETPLPRPPHQRHRVASTPAFQLFPPNAVISLTEDNNTFFPARPAAFGAELPDNGLSAALWIGAGFGEDGVEPQGELGCSDVPGWDGNLAFDGVPIFPVEGPDDGTDNYLEEYLPDTTFRSRQTVPAAAAVERGDHTTDDVAAADAAADDDAAAAAAPVPAATGQHSDIESLQEGAEIAGKVVLLRRGGCGFLAKVMWAQRRGAVAVIVGDDRKGGPLIQMYAAGDTSFVTIPSVFTAHTTAHLLTALVSTADVDETAASKRAAALDATAPERSGVWFRRTRPREWVLDDFVPTGTAAGAKPVSTPARVAGGHTLFVTISPTRGTLPLMDLVLVVIGSPVLAVFVLMGVLMFIRTHYRSRAWRAPKALVEQLPVHIYADPGTPSPDTMTVPAGSDVASPMPSPPRSPSPPTLEPTMTTPLLQRPRSRTTTGVPGDERRAHITVAAPAPHVPRYFQAECVVCLEDYVVGDRVMSLPCGHEFHAACITPWLTTRRRTCPICKGDVVKAATAGEAA